MEKDTNQKVDENLLDQLLTDFIYEYLVPQRALSYTEFKFDYNKFDFYLKAVDKLIPNAYIVDSSYVFNKETILRLSRNNLESSFLKGREEFFKYLKTELNNSKSYLKYLNRISGV